MAITSSIFNTDFAAFKRFMDGLVPDFFASVTYDDDTNLSITCKDDDGNALVTVSTDQVNDNAAVWTWTYYASEGLSITRSKNTIKAVAGYKCTNGALLILSQNASNLALSSNGAVMISKTNNGITGIVATAATTTSQSLYSPVLSVAWGDVEPLSSDMTLGVGSYQNQTLLYPFTTHCALGQTSYFPNAFFMPVTQLSSRQCVGQLVLNGISYVTNGYWVLKDEEY